MSGSSAKLEMILEAIDRASGPIKGVEKALDRLERATGRSSGQMSSLGEKGERALKAVATAALAAGAALAVVGKNVISAAADFETSLTGIQKKAGTTAEATAAIGEEIKALSTSGALAAPISEIAAAYERGAAAGLPIAELKDFATLSVKGADAFEMSAEAVGNFSAKLRTGLGMTNEEVKQVLDLTNSLADAGIADESTIVDFMDRSGATLKTLGFAKEQSLALGATLLNIGMQSETAATGSSALAGKLLTVGTLAGKGKKNFEKYMGSVKGFSKLVEKDANGALLKMLDKLKSLNKAQRAEFLQGFVGAEWTDEMLRLVEASDEYRRNLALAADTSKWMGSLDTSYQLKLDDFWSQWEVAKNNLEKLAIDLGTLAMPSVKAGLAEAQAIVEDIGANIKAFPALIDQGALTDAMASLAKFRTAIEDLLNIETSGSQVTAFFRDLARAVDAVSATINLVAEAVKTIKEYMPGQSEAEKNSPTRPENSGASFADRGLGWVEIEEGGLVDQVRDVWQRNIDRLLGDTPRVNYDPAYPPPGYAGTPVAGPSAADQLSASANAGWGQWDEGLAAIERYKQGLVSLQQLYAELKPKDVDPGLIETPGENQVHRTIALLEQLVATPATPQIAAPVQAEGAAAVQAATTAGQQIVTAASVTATPTIDTSSIDAATGKVQALGTAIRSLPSAGAGAASSVPIDGARAAGGPVNAGGLYLVGERGPELFSPGTGGMISTARDTNRLFQSAGSSGGGVGGGAGGGAIDASIHIASVNVASPQGREDFEARLREHQRVITDMVQGEARRQSRTAF